MEFGRNKYVQRLIARKHNGLIKIVTGLRRSGKSYLLNTLFYNHLLECGIKPNHIIKFAFDSADDLATIGEDYIEINTAHRKVSAKKFMQYVHDKICDNEMYFLLLDEVQLLECFEAVLNGFLRKANLDIYVTGSNSRFLSSDVVTEFAGRGDEVHLYPLSLAEIYDTIGGDATKLYDEYKTYGGLPIVVNTIDEVQKTTYLKSQINNVYLKDIVMRQNVRKTSDLDDLLNIIASNISCLSNPNKLSNSFESLKKAKLSPVTIDKYLTYFCESFLIEKALRYDVKGKKYIGTPFKLYFEDVGLRNAELNFRQIEPPHIMENIIYNELRYRGYCVDVGIVEDRAQIDNHNIHKSLEVDFVANLGSQRYYIQSAYNIPGEEKWAQEIRPLNKIDDSFKKILIVAGNMKPNRTEQGFVVMGIIDFLLDYNSLEF